MRVLLLVALFVALAAPARAADDVARLSLDSGITGLVAGPDGAWVTIHRTTRDVVGIAKAGSFRTVSLGERLRGAAVGLDGQPWFHAGWNELVRLDGTRVGGFGTLSRGIAVGPDGSVWTTTANGLVRGGRLVSLEIPTCALALTETWPARASDGTMWLADAACRRFVHLAADGRVLSVNGDSDSGFYATGVAPDAEGGIWFSVAGTFVAGHVDAAGQITTHGTLPDDQAVSVAVAPDGAAWFALGRCALARATAAGTTVHPAPVPATELAFDGTGAMWLASERHLVRTTTAELSAEGCDQRPPRVTVSPRTRRLSLAALRRDGLRVRANEPARVLVSPLYELGHSSGSDEGRWHNAPFRYRLPPRRLRQIESALAAGRRVELSLEVAALDFEGNHRSKIVTWRIV